MPSAAMIADARTVTAGPDGAANVAVGGFVRGAVARVDADQSVTEPHVGSADPSVHGVEQYPVQFTAVDRQLRPAIPGGASTRLAPDLATVLGEVAERRRFDGVRGEHVEQAERVELADRVGEQVDPDAGRADLVGGLEDRHVDADLVQAQRGREPADAGADDCDAATDVHDRHVTSNTLIRTTDLCRSPADTAMMSFIPASAGSAVDSRMWVRK